MSREKTDWAVPLFFAFAAIALLPPLMLFALFKPMGASVISAGWLTLMTFTAVALMWTRSRIRPTTPAAAIVTSLLGLKAHNDRVLGGDVDGLPVVVIWMPNQYSRIDVRVGRREAKELDAWSAGLLQDQRLAMFEVIGSGELEVVGEELQAKTPLAFSVAEHGEELAFRIRDAVRIAKTLSLAGTPPEGCVGRLRDERRAIATPGTLSIAAPAAAEGALSVATGAGALSPAKKA